MTTTLNLYRTIYLATVAVALLLLVTGRATAQWNPSPSPSPNTNIYYNAGNVGIGTTSPVAMFDIANMFTVSSDAVVSWGGSHDYGRLSWDSGKAMIFGQSGKALSLGADGAPDKLWIATSGNVGIGTTAPIGLLHVKASTNDNVWIGGHFNLADGVAIFAGTDTGSAVKGMEFGASKYYFGGGNVGIGTTSPGYLLDAKLAGSGTGATIGVGDVTYGTYGTIGFATSGSKFQLTGTGGQAITLGSNGVNDRLYMDTSGNVGIGITTPGSYKLNVAGDTNVSGDLNVTGNIKAKFQDMAEWVPTSEQLHAGAVVVLDITKSNQVVRSTQAYDTRVAGVISERPGLALGESGEGRVLVATTGRVMVNVDTTKGPIHIGDLLVTSNIPGMAMKSDPVNLGGVQLHRPGTLIGKALEPLEKGSGKILVLLSLQ